MGVVILSSRLLPRVLGYLAIVLGAAFAIAGVVYLFDLTLPVLVQAFASIQVLWWLAAAIMLIVRPQKTSDTPSVKEQEPGVPAQFSAHAYPREIEFVSALPKTPSGKIQR